MNGGNDTLETSAPWPKLVLSDLRWLFNLRNRNLTREDFIAAGRVPLGRCVVYFIALCCVPNGCVFLHDIPQVPAQVREFLLFVPLLSVLFSLGVIFAVFPIGLVLLLVSGLRGLGVRVVLLCAIYLATFCIAFSTGPPIRTASFHALAARSMPLVKAVHAYEKAEGRAPNSLEDLVPKYLDSVPSTGLAAYPDYEIHKGEDSSIWQGNPWVLCVPCSRSMLNWDLFLYFPNQDYPLDESSAFERMGAWAYWHE